MSKALLKRIKRLEAHRDAQRKRDKDKADAKKKRLISSVYDTEVFKRGLKL